MPSRIKNSGKRGIRRYEYDGVVGWQVRYCREKALFQQVFSDKLHGGEKGALAAAEDFHAQLVTFFPPMLRREFVNQRRTNKKAAQGFKAVRISRLASALDDQGGKACKQEFLCCSPWRRRSEASRRGVATAESG
jgi:hypothetical protein